MKYDPEKQHRPFGFAQARHSIRLRGYDYTRPGAYFLTIVAQDRACLFDDPVLRSVVETYWQAIPGHAAHVTLDVWVLMPNHLHGIIVITERPATVWARHSQEVSSSMLEVPADEMPTFAAGPARNALPLQLASSVSCSYN